MKTKKWGQQRLEVQRCGMAIAEANRKGIMVKDELYAEMGQMFTPDEIEAIASYLFYVGENLPGADYLSSEEMDAKVEEKLAGV